MRSTRHPQFTMSWPHSLCAAGVSRRSDGAVSPLRLPGGRVPLSDGPLGYSQVPLGLSFPAFHYYYWTTKTARGRFPFASCRHC